MRALSAKPTAPSATVAARTPRGPRRSATRPDERGHASHDEADRQRDGHCAAAPAERVREHGKEDAERRHRGGDARRDGEQRDDDPPARREHARSSYDSAMAKPYVLEFGMGVDVHGADATTAAKR